MLAGKVAGVSVISNDGTPGGGAQIRIRGGSSLNASNDPLIVIDGLAIDNNGIKGMSNGLSMVNPEDIETFTVLKDASATAIYGSRASNGVIIITTKKGKNGQAPKVSYNGSVSVSTIQKRYDVLDGDEYRAYAQQIFGDELPASLGTASTDWQDEIFRPAISTDHHVSINGGLKNLPYRISLGYNYNDGILKTSNFQRFTASVNLAPSFFDDHLKVNITAKYMNGKTDMQILGLLLEGLYLWILPALYMGMIVCMMYLEVITRMHKLHPTFQIQIGNTQPTRIRHRIRWQHWNRRMTELIAMILLGTWKWIINSIFYQTYVCMPV